MQTLPELMDEIYRDRVLRARRQPLEAKFLAGAELFEQVCERMKAGLRAENPGADAATIDQLLRQRLDRLPSLERVR